MTKLLIIGLDCFEPSLVEKWLDDLPTFRALLENGAWGKLRSSHPPITVPAWTSMLSGRDPGELGIYGFRNRASYAYDDFTIATSTSVKEPRVWELLAQAGKQCIIVGIPQTWPLKPVDNVLQISSFLTPPGADYADPPQLQEEVETLLSRQGYSPIYQQGIGARQQAGSGRNRALIYETDTHDFRTEDKAELLADLYRMTDKRWLVLNHLIQEKPWDFFMVVEMGTDRIHHAFWEYMDPQHIHYPGPGNRFETAIHDYYVCIDEQMARLLEKVPEDTILMVVSDHGARRMEGGFAINEWLKREELLVLKEEPKQPVAIEKAQLDWSQTRVWGSGGYYARIFFNVAEREQEGILPAGEYEAFRNQLIEGLEAVTGPDGTLLGNAVVKPEDIYRQVNNFAPDLILYPGNLAWRSVGTVGSGELFIFENDTGPDGANHDWDGIFVLYDPVRPGSGKFLTGLQLENIAPLILTLLGVNLPDYMIGQGNTSSEINRSGYDRVEEKSVLDHLEALGYL
jgi:predicted AlkP superfamily phosphohydrolase/phosphomutase